MKTILKRYNHELTFWIYIFENKVEYFPQPQQVGFRHPRYRELLPRGPNITHVTQNRRWSPTGGPRGSGRSSSEPGCPQPRTRMLAQNASARGCGNTGTALPVTLTRKARKPSSTQRSSAGPPGWFTASPAKKWDDARNIAGKRCRISGPGCTSNGSAWRGLLCPGRSLVTALSSVLIIAYRIKTILDRTVTVVIENVNGSLFLTDPKSGNQFCILQIVPRCDAC